VPEPLPELPPDVLDTSIISQNLTTTEIDYKIQVGIAIGVTASSLLFLISIPLSIICYFQLCKKK